MTKSLSIGTWYVHIVWCSLFLVDLFGVLMMDFLKPNYENKNLYGFWCICYSFLSLLTGWTKLPFVWVHNMCCSYSGTSSKNSVTRNFAFIWRVCMSSMIFTSLICFLLLSSYIINGYWHPCCVLGRSWILWTFYFTWLQWLLFSFFLLHSIWKKMWSASRWLLPEMMWRSFGTCCSIPHLHILSIWPIFWSQNIPVLSPFRYASLFI